MSDLRARAIETMTRAIWEEWEALPDYEALSPDGKDNAHADLEIVLDALLAFLTEHAEDWDDAAFRIDPHVMGPLPLLAVLAEEEE